MLPPPIYTRGIYLNHHIVTRDFETEGTGFCCSLLHYQPTNPSHFHWQPCQNYKETRYTDYVSGISAVMFLLWVKGGTEGTGAFVYSALDEGALLSLKWWTFWLHLQMVGPLENTHMSPFSSGMICSAVGLLPKLTVPKATYADPPFSFSLGSCWTSFYLPHKTSSPQESAK